MSVTEDNFINPDLSRFIVINHIKHDHRMLKII
ncbi:hypothetical protein SAMN05444274_101166 [Mariniphaga anaerophila]|uniref:Uncharacterized protein n=1 Tax=Mariniphaga anaerophila TaxID=1484053 RepID=A0A1M4SVY0_9BACT|nr:hypothetical protein SAMN05444274_101166 [Mariniphaga anaerophila]